MNPAIPIEVNGVAIDYLGLGLDVDGCRAYLSTNAPAMVPVFDEVVAKAAQEQ